MTLDQKARALALMYVAIWANWNDELSDDGDNALRMIALQVRAIDLHQTCGTISSSLNYFTIAILDGQNPEDLTYAEMIQSIAICLSL